MGRLKGSLNWKSSSTIMFPEMLALFLVFLCPLSTPDPQSPVVNVKVGADSAWMTIHGKSRVRGARGAFPWSKWDDYDTTTWPDALMRLQRRNKKGRRALSPWSKWDDYDTTTWPDALMRLQRRNKKGRRALSPWSKW